MSRLGDLFHKIKPPPPLEVEISMIDPWSARTKSLRWTESLGYPVDPKWQLLEKPTSVRSVEEVFNRMICTFTVAVCAFGLDRAIATSWLEREGLYEALNSDEREFLQSGSEPESHRDSVEALAALAWATKHLNRLDFAQSFDEDFVFIFPNILRGDSSHVMRDKSKLRKVGAIFQQYDLCFCLKASIEMVDAHAMHQPGVVHPEVVNQRMAALGWLLEAQEFAEQASPSSGAPQSED